MSRTTSYGYDANGNNTSQTLPDSTSVSAEFDALNRRTQLNSSAGSFQQQYDLAGNILNITESYPTGVLSPRQLALQYDNAYRLTSQVISNQAGGEGPWVVFSTSTYGYDNANNQDSRTVVTAMATESDTFAYNALNQMTSFTRNGTEVASYLYDLNGCRKTLSSGSGTVLYQYDYDNRLVGMVGTGGGTDSYVYDYRIRRVGLTVGATSSRIAFSGGTSVTEYDVASGDISAQYVRGLNQGGGVGGLLYSLRGSTVAVNRYNNRGDVTAQTNAADASLTWLGQYDAYGTFTETTASNQDPQRSNTKEQDPTGLINDGFRYRDPVTGTFITRDSIGFVDGPNLYTYVRQNPWTHFDPEGLASNDYDLNSHDPIHLSMGTGTAGTNSTTPAPSARKVNLNAVPISLSASGLSQLPISDRSIRLMYDQEVGGGKSYYNKFLQHPEWPGGASGVTIGIGYDLGQNTKAGFTQDWSSSLSAHDMNLLGATVGKQGSSAHAKLQSVAGVTVPWDAATSVFVKKTLPQVIKETFDTYPGSSMLSPDSLGALVSMDYNRGPAMTSKNPAKNAALAEKRE